MRIHCIIPLILAMSCTPSCGATQDVKTAATDTFKCAVRYSADVIVQTAMLVEKLQETPDFVNNLISWAEGAKDSQFAMCVMTTVVADISKNHGGSGSGSGSSNPAIAAKTMMSPPVDELTPAVENFRQRHFGKLKFEVPDISKQ